MYNAQQQAGAQGAGFQQQGPTPGAEQSGKNDGKDVTDVPFEEVK
jgi:hypothetical protein